ncbi:MAG: ABC transporter ATP-binding protein [Vulcanimicrobiaceae bacterium]
MHDVPVPARLDHVSKLFRKTVALRDLSLEVRPGETLALLGPNGAGKTTAVRTLLGLLQPSAGNATVFGRDPRRRETRTRIGAMLQVSTIPATLTVGEHIGLFSRYYPTPLPVAQTIRLAKLEGLEGRRAGELSGGQRQRLFFALAVCGDPDLLVLDEPTVGLDVEARAVIWERIRALVAAGRSILLTTHYLTEAEALADRVAVINGGKIVVAGTVDSLKRSLVGITIRCRTALSPEALAALPAVQSTRATLRERELVTSDADATLRALYARDAACAVLEVSRGDLESAYLAVTASASREAAASTEEFVA